MQYIEWAYCIAAAGGVECCLHPEMGLSVGVTDFLLLEYGGLQPRPSWED